MESSMEKIIHSSLKAFEKMKHTCSTVFPQFFNDSLPLRQNCYIHAVGKLSTVLHSQGKLY